MPRYDYLCREDGYLFEEVQSFHSEPGAICPKCGAKAQRQISIPAVHYKGSGFYTTDHARSNVGRSGGGRSSGDGDSEKSSDKAKKDSKSSSSSGTKASSGSGKSGSD